jgi:hypothetical protein
MPPGAVHPHELVLRNRHELILRTRGRLLDEAKRTDRGSLGKRSNRSPSSENFVGWVRKAVDEMTTEIVVQVDSVKFQAI